MVAHTNMEVPAAYIIHIMAVDIAVDMAVEDMAEDMAVDTVPHIQAELV